jgi:hypothetical protein
MEMKFPSLESECKLSVGIGVQLVIPFTTGPLGLRKVHSSSTKPIIPQVQDGPFALKLGCARRANPPLRESLTDDHHLDGHVVRGP